MSAFIESFSPNANTVNLRWGDFLAIVLAKKLAIQYTTGVDTYNIWAVDGPVVYQVGSPGLVFTSSSPNYPFPLADGYTQAQNDTDVGTFTGTYQAGANAVALSSVGALGIAAPISASLIGGIDPAGFLQAPGITDASTAATTSQRAMVVAISPNTPITVSSALSPDRNATGTITAANANLTSGAPTAGSTVAISGAGVGDIALTITGTWSATLQFQGTIDGTNWFAIDAMPNPVLASSTCVQSTTANGQWTFASAGLVQVRVTASAYTSGTATVTLNGNQASSVSEGIHTVQQATASNLNALVQQGAPNTLANAWPVEMTDGTNVLGTSAHPVRIDPTGTTTQPVSGTVTANQGTNPWIVAGAGTAGAPGTAVLTIQGISGGTAVPVSGTVAVTQSTSPWVTSDLADGSVGGGTAGTKSMLGGLVFNTAAPTLTNGQQAALQGDASANLLVKVNVALPAGSNTIGAVTQASGPWTMNLTEVGGAAIALGQTTMASSIPVAIASNQSAIPVTQSTSPWIVKDQADGSVSGGAAGSFSMLAGLIYNTTDLALTNGQQASLQGDALGNLKVTVQDGSRASYAASKFALAVATTPTDVLTIQGSATKTVRITRISISGQQSSGGTADFRLIVRSAADTGGTSATVTAVPMDSNDASASAVVKSYTANPTALGAAVGDIQDLHLYIPGSLASEVSEPFSLQFGSLAGGKAVVLRGTTQFLVINMNGVSMSGSALNLTVEWTEE